MFPALDPAGTYLEDEGMALSEFESFVRPLSVEHACIFDLSGEPLMRIKVGEISCVALCENECQLLQNAVFSHNHPRDSFLSASDIVNASEFNGLEVRAVVSDGVFVARRSGRDWPQKNEIEGLYRHVRSASIQFLNDEFEHAKLGGSSALHAFQKRLRSVEFEKFEEIFPIIGVSISFERADEEL